jgi:hemerythrin-like metal-binding protein
MALFEWTNEYSVSVQRFDTEHQRLFAILNELNDAMAEGRGRFVVARVLQELSEYSRWHFSGEESAMRRTGFDGLEDHIAEHRVFSEKIEAMYAECDKAEANLPIELLYFLCNWLQNHIRRTDQQYARFLNRAGIY